MSITSMQYMHYHFWVEPELINLHSMTRNDSSIMFRTEVIILNCKAGELSCAEGRVPEMAPLANPYVPFQLKNPPVYQLQKGLVRGTLFPGLELPFLGMINKNNLPVTPLTELQALAFGIQELALYLDTHSDDIEALELYRSYQKLYVDGKKKYEQMFGPLNHVSQTEGSYQWLLGPWPWEYAANREV